MECTQLAELVRIIVSGAKSGTAKRLVCWPSSPKSVVCVPCSRARSAGVETIIIWQRADARGDLLAFKKGWQAMIGQKDCPGCQGRGGWEDPEEGQWVECKHKKGNVMSEIAKCQLCGEPMPAGEEMFNFHGYSGNCPKPPLPSTDLSLAIYRWKRFRAGESLDTIYPLADDWESHHEGTRDGAQRQLLTADAFALADRCASEGRS